MNIRRSRGSLKSPNTHRLSAGPVVPYPTRVERTAYLRDWRAEAT
jgi:hypothetical protein